MAMRVKGRANVLSDPTEYEVYWTEFKSIEESGCHVENEEELPKEVPGDPEQDIQWLTLAGFHSIVSKFRTSNEIDPDDPQLMNITSSLTRKQAAAVRKRIDSLNSQGTGRRPPLSPKSPTRTHPADVRTIFPAATPQQNNATPQHNNATPQLNHGTPQLNHGTPQLNQGTPQLIVGSPQFNQGAPQLNHGRRPGLKRRAYSEGVHVSQLASQNRPVPKGEPLSPDKETSRSHGTLLETTDELKVPEVKERRSSDDMRLQSGTGVQSHTNKVHGSVFYITGKATTAKQELFNAAEKTKESSVDDEEELSKMSNLSVSDIEDDKEYDRFREASPPPRDIPETPTDGHNNHHKPEEQKPGKQKDDFQCPQFPSLPNFTLTKEELGLTRIGDLSNEDMEKVQSLALIELTALFDSHGISIVRRKYIKKKVSVTISSTESPSTESCIFGRALAHLVQQDRAKAPGVRTPIILQQMIRFLLEHGINEEGILRVPGSSVRIKQMRDEIEEKFYEGGFSWEGRRPNDVAALLKQFLRELPFPLLTHEYLPTFVAVEELGDRRQQLQALNLLILLLPRIHRDTLRLLLLFLCKVMSKEKKNKMNLNNIAMIMAPNLFMSGGKVHTDIKEVKKAQRTVNIVRMLIKYHTILWTIPGFMVMQVRYLYEAEGSRKAKDTKAVRKLLAKKVKDKQQEVGKKEEDGKGLPELENAIIRVRAPTLNKIGTAIQLTEDTRAGDIVARFRRRTDGSSDSESQLSQSCNPEYANCVNPKIDDDTFAHENHYLFEVGGNIGERCLDHDCNMRALCKVNSNADWVIKKKDEYNLTYYNLELPFS